MVMSKWDILMLYYLNFLERDNRVRRHWPIQIFSSSLSVSLASTLSVGLHMIHWCSLLWSTLRSSYGDLRDVVHFLVSKFISFLLWCFSLFSLSLLYDFYRLFSPFLFLTSWIYWFVFIHRRILFFLLRIRSSILK